MNIFLLLLFLLFVCIKKWSSGLLGKLDFLRFLGSDAFGQEILEKLNRNSSFLRSEAREFCPCGMYTSCGQCLATTCVPVPRCPVRSRLLRGLCFIVGLVVILSVAVVM